MGPRKVAAAVVVDLLPGSVAAVNGSDEAHPSSEVRNRHVLKLHKGDRVRTCGGAKLQNGALVPVGCDD